MIKFNEYLKAREEYLSDLELHGNLRFGQFMCDRFDIKEEECPGLFYENSYYVANSMILSELVEIKE